MSKFMLGVERSTKAIHEALNIMGFTEASKFIKEEFLEKIDEGNIDFTLNEIYGRSRKELEKLRSQRKK